VYYYVLDSTVIIAATYLGIIFGNISDMDLTIKKKWHRHFLFHGLHWVALMWLFSLQYPIVMLIFAFCCFGVGLHLLEDINIFKGRTGFYCIKMRVTLTGKVKGINGKWTTVWLFSNFLFSIAILLVTCAWVI